MIDLSNEELTIAESADLRRVFSHLDDLAPMAPDFTPMAERRHNPRERGALVVAVVVAVVSVAAGIGLWRSPFQVGDTIVESVDAVESIVPAETAESNTDGATADSDISTPEQEPDSSRSATEEPVFAPVPAPPGFNDVVADPSTGVLYGVDQGHVKRSADGGSTWETIREADHGFRSVTLTPTGALVAVLTYQDPLPDLVAEGFVSNRTPEVHRYDPGADSWQVIELPRPALPGGSTEPQAEQTAECPLFGGQSWVSASAATAGSEVAVLGVHRIVAAGVCDRSTPILWLSTDGIDWEMTELTLADGHPVGIDTVGDGYVAIGDAVANATPPWDELRLWHSVDLRDWTPVVFDPAAAGLPSLSTVVVDPFTGFDATRSDDGRLRLSFPVVEMGPGITTSISDLDELSEVIAANSGDVAGPGRVPELEAILARDLDVTFALDDGDVLKLRACFDHRVDLGLLTATSDLGGSWSFNFHPDG